jgi:hypothetical protein
MKSFWHFLGALILLLVAGSFIYRVVYSLRTGRDLEADRAQALANWLNAVKAQRDLAQTNTSVGSNSLIPAAAQTGTSNADLYNSL